MLYRRCNCYKGILLLEIWVDFLTLISKICKQIYDGLECPSILQYRVPFIYLVIQMHVLKLNTFNIHYSWILSVRIIVGSIMIK